MGLILHLLGYSAETLLMGAESLLPRSDFALEPKNVQSIKSKAGKKFKLNF